MRSSKTPLSFDDDTNEILSHSLSLCRLSQNVFLIIKRVFQTLSDDVNTKRISRALAEHFFVLAFVLETRFKKCFIVRARIFARSIMMIFSFFWGKNSRCGLKKTLDTRGLSRSSRKKGLRKNEWCDLFLSLSFSLERARGGTLVKTLSRLARRKAVCCGRVYYVARRRKLSRWKEGVKTTRRRGKMRCENSFKNQQTTPRAKKRKRANTQEQKRVLLRGKKCEHKEYCRR